VGADLFYADGQTGMKKIIVAFLNFSKAPKNRICITLSKICEPSYLVQTQNGHNTKGRTLI